MAATRYTDTETLYALYRQHPVITTDSRKISPGSLFFALKGDHFNGNQFAGQALAQGAAVAIVDDPAVIEGAKTEETMNVGEPAVSAGDHTGADGIRNSGAGRYALVDDVLHSLQQLALQHRKQMSIPVIGITGSNGKTTTKELVHAVLSTKYRTLSTSGNLNNHIGVPLTLLSIGPDTEIAVIEMGANHPGEIAFLCELARPTHGLITNIGRAHLEGFGGFEGVVRTKTELYNFLRNHAGEVFINAGDPLLAGYVDGIPAIPYGLTPEAAKTEPLPGIPAGTSGKLLPEPDLLSLDISFPDGRREVIRSSLFGSFNALNLLAAACTGFHFNVEPCAIARALEACTPRNNRSQLHRTARNLLVLDAYNANPSSMAVALNEFHRIFPSHKAVILGDMLELGSDAEREHQAILDMLDTLQIPQVYLVGPLFGKLNSRPDWIVFQNSQEAKEWFERHPLSQANILLKGSRGIHLEEIVPCL